MYRRMNQKASARPGKYNPDLTPWVYGMLEAIDDPKIRKVVCRKSAQVAWTDGVIVNYLGRRIHLDPCGMVLMFPKADDGAKFDREKLTPMIEVTPVVRDLVPIHRKRDKDNGRDHKGFPGGFINLVGSNSPGSVKSSSAPVVIIEEPDDSNTNLKGQGDTITLLEERTKTFQRSKVIYGGTPTVEGFSRIDDAYRGSDQRQYLVACPDCDERQPLIWDQVRWSDDPARNHEIYGQAVPESARYACAHCGSLWTNAQKSAAVLSARRRKEAGESNIEWVGTAQSAGVAGFAISEVYSRFPGSSLTRLVEKYLTAQHALTQGSDGKWRSFVNNTMGLPFAYTSTVPTADVLRERAEGYPELTVPWGGVVLTAGVDVQHDRLAVVIRAWGRGEESWLTWWGEIPGRTLLCVRGPDGQLDKANSGAWGDLDDLLTGTFVHASGGRLRVRAASIDSSDGQTQDAVYSYVRGHIGRGWMAIKGDSARAGEKDIFTAPKTSIDTTARHKPHPSGVRPYMVGTGVAKDLILGVDDKGGRIKLLGRGPGRMHWYDGVRPDYYDQVTSEVKVPHRSIRGRMVWACKSGQRNEALDCEVYALHAARALKLHLWREDRWNHEESVIQQAGLFESVDSDAKPADAAPVAARPAEPARVTQPVARPAQSLQRPGRGGWSAKRW